MTKIIIKNAGICVNPVLTKAQRAVSSGTTFPVGTPLLIYYIEINTVNEPGTMYFDYSIDGGSSWTVLYTQPSVQGPFVYGYGPLPPLGCLCRVRVINESCGTRTSNSKPQEL
jgi:hypothetical protein